MRQREVEIPLPREPLAPAISRRTIEETLDGVLPPLALDDAKLVATELVANALDHGEGSIRLRLAVERERVRIEVADEGSGRAPQVRPAPGDSTGGWGLRLVDTICERWGAFEGTTHVWAELRTGG